MTEAIRCDGLTRHFDDRIALDGLTLSVPAGEVLALLGPNGAGKTTTVRLLNGVLDATGGSASVLGLDPRTDGDRLRHRTGVLTENAGLDDRLTARENLRATARLRGIRGPAAEDRVSALLDRFGMGPAADQRCQGFSTGQRRRVALARALIGDPEVLFLDEPTSGLDPAATVDVIGLIETLARERGRTVVLCTHFLAEAARVADRMAIIHRGRLVTAGRPDELAHAMWPTLRVEIDLGTRPADATTALVRSLRGVSSATPGAGGLTVEVADRDVVPALVRTLAAGDTPVYGITPRPRTLEDVYFAYQDMLGAETSGLRAGLADAPALGEAA